MGDYGFDGAGDFGGSDFPSDYIPGKYPPINPRKRQLELEIEILEIEIKCIQRKIAELKTKLLEEI